MSTLFYSKFNCTIHFVNPVDGRFNCAICLDVANEPLSCGSKIGCTGVFCTYCLTEALKRKKSCPKCILESIAPAKNNIVKELIYDQEIYCAYSNFKENVATKKGKKNVLKPRFGCQWRGSLGELEGHVAHDCQCAPVACTNEGCRVVVHRKELDDHLAVDCLFRSVTCMHCSLVLRFDGLEAHIAVCYKVTLVCVDCQAPYLREVEGVHETTCPEKPVTCPFACHGCSDIILRKEFGQHQLDSAVAHSDLLAAKLVAEGVKVAAYESKLDAEGVKVAALENKLDAEGVKVAALESKLDAEGVKVAALEHKLDAEGVKVAALENKLDAEEAKLLACSVELADVQKSFKDHKSRLVNVAVVPLEWTISDATAKLSSNATLKSKDFALEGTVGSSVMYLKCDLRENGEAAVWLHKDLAKSVNKGPSSLDGSTITLKHPTDRTKDDTGSFSSTKILREPVWSYGWKVFTRDIRPFISAEDKIAFKCVVRVQEEAEAVIEV